MGCSDIQSEIDSLNDEISTYEGYISELEGYKEETKTAKKNINDSVLEWNKLYDMTQENKWKGKRLDKAVKRQGYMTQHIKTAFKEVNTFIGNINSIIDIYKDKIQACKDRISELEEELERIRAAELEASNS